MMAGPSFGSAVAVSQGAGELELGMSDFLGFGWAGFLGRGTAAPGRCITGGDAPRVGDASRGATRRVGDAPRGRRTASPLRYGRVGFLGAWHRCAGAMRRAGGDAPRGRRTALGGRRAAWATHRGGGRRAALGGRRAAGGRRTASPLHGNVGVAWGRSTATPLHSHNPPFTINRPVLDHS